MAVRNPRHAHHDDNQLILDFPCDTPSTAAEGPRASSLPQLADEGAGDGRHKEATPRRGGCHTQQTAVLGAGVAAVGTRRPTGASLIRRGQSATAVPRRPSPLDPTPGGHAVDPAPIPTHRSRCKAWTNRTDETRAPAGAPELGPGEEVAARKRRSESKPLAEYVAEIVDAAPPLSDTQRSRLAVLLRGSTVGWSPQTQARPPRVHDGSSLAPLSAD